MDTLIKSKLRGTNYYIAMATRFSDINFNLFDEKRIFYIANSL